VLGGLATLMLVHEIIYESIQEMVQGIIDTTKQAARRDE
jgi:hypothetical protein